MVYGYHRTATEEQHLDRGIKSIKDYCNENKIPLKEIFADQQTGKNFDRPEYKVLKRLANEKGDIIIISEIDRLGRNKTETLKELQHYKNLGVIVRILEIPTTLIDYSNKDDNLSAMLMETINNMLIEMYATFAHAEMNKREKRQKEGIAAKKARGEWDDYGRPKSLELKTFEEQYKKVLGGEIKAVECMQLLNISKSTYYRYKKQFHC